MKRCLNGQAQPPNSIQLLEQLPKSPECVPDACLVCPCHVHVVPYARATIVRAPTACTVVSFALALCPLSCVRFRMFLPCCAPSVVLSAKSSRGLSACGLLRQHVLALRPRSSSVVHSWPRRCCAWHCAHAERTWLMCVPWLRLGGYLLLSAPSVMAEVDAPVDFSAK